MAPEVARAFAASRTKLHGDAKASDVFSAGMVFYEILFETRPYSFDVLKQKKEPALPAELTTDAAEAASSVEGLVRDMLEWQWRLRPSFAKIKMRLLEHVRTSYSLGRA
jgi:hypothetical protein